MRAVCVAAFTFLVAVSAAAQSADLFVTKSAPGTASVGTNITFTVTVGNNGPDDAALVNMTDPLPPAPTFVSETQTNTAQFDIVVNVSQSAAGTTLINSATVSSETPDDNDENNPAITGTSVSGGNLADVRIQKTGPVSQPADTDVTYTITLVNDGPNDATNVSFTDTLPNSIPPSSPLTFVSFTQNSGPTFSC